MLQSIINVSQFWQLRGYIVRGDDSNTMAPRLVDLAHDTPSQPHIKLYLIYNWTKYNQYNSNVIGDKAITSWPQGYIVRRNTSLIPWHPAICGSCA